MNIEDIKLGKETFRIRKYDTLNIVVERLVSIDPTKSPTFDPEKHRAEIRYKYRDPKYHATLESALDSMVERATIESEVETLEDLLVEIRQFKREIRRLMSVE